MTQPVSRAMALQRLTLQLRDSGIDTAALDARFLMMEAANLTATDLYAWPDEPMEPAALTRLSKFAQRRMQREPVARILGEWEFWGLPFRLSPATLVPRPETELLVEAAIAEYHRAGIDSGRFPDRFVDIGTGTGCIAVAVAHELSEIHGVAIDLSPEAAAMARHNANSNGVGGRVSVLNGSWTSMLADCSIDMILSNPPYIETLDIAALDIDVKDHDPHLALDGGADGLAPYRAIFADAKRILRPRGVVIVEFGRGQTSMVTAIAENEGFNIKAVLSDLSDLERVIVATIM